MLTGVFKVCYAAAQKVSSLRSGSQRTGCRQNCSSQSVQAFQLQTLHVIFICIDKAAAARLW